MLWTSSQQTVIDQFIQEIKTIGWFKQVGEPSEKYWVIDTIWEACDTYGHQMLEVWGQNSELIEQKALRQLKDEQIDAIFEMGRIINLTEFDQFVSQRIKLYFFGIIGHHKCCRNLRITHHFCETIPVFFTIRT